MLDLLVIGGGPAGVTAALRGRELGAEVTLVDRDGIGGTCTNDGCVPTRVLAHVARLVRDAGQFAQYGLIGEAPQVDFARVLAAARDTVARIHDKKRMAHHLDEMGVRLVGQSGGARFTDANTLTCADGTQVQARKIILATGGHARRLPFPGVEHALTHSDIWTMTHLPRSLVIVGGAATGCQLASVFASFGARITMLEVGHRLLGVEDEDVSQGIEQAFARRGIEVICQIGGVDHLDRLPHGTLRLTYTRKDKLHDIEAEAALLAVGWQANSVELSLDVAGVECERGYIRVDDSLQTTASHIFACGDVTGRMMLVQSAIAEGALAAESAMLGPGGRGTHRIVPHGGFTDPEYGSVGLTEAQARAQEDCAVAVVPYAHCDRAAIDGHTKGFCKLIVSKSTHRMLGAHIVGEQAVEILQMVAAGMAADMWVDQLAELELAYPTFAAIVGLAARQIMRELGEVPLVSQWREQRYSAAAEWERSKS
jgi:pyruvate/2-oxoglutarate dehydrogenase complex dihydrolipoamide dehydrogenase (E3) component